VRISKGLAEGKIVTVLVLPTMPSTDRPENDYAEIVLHVNARVISATRVRRKVNGWLALEVGDRVLAGEPELVIDSQLVWRVPVHWTSSTQGILVRHIAAVLVDAVTGEILNQSMQSETILKRVEDAARPPQSTTK
jgi:hypothetical protein